MAIFQSQFTGTQIDAGIQKANTALQSINLNEHDLSPQAHAVKFTDYLTEDEVNLLLQEHLESLLIDKGSVATKNDLLQITTANNYDSYLVEDESIIYFSYNKSTGLEWLPLNFFADMSLYETVSGATEKMNASIEAARNYTDTQVAACAPNTLASAASNGLMSATDKTRLTVYTITDFNAFNPATLGIGANGYGRPVYSGGDALNRPFTGSFATVGTITQESSSRFVLFVKVSNNSAEYTAYTRQYSGTAWLAWQPVPNASRINALEARIAALEAVPEAS